MDKIIKSSILVFSIFAVMSCNTKNADKQQQQLRLEASQAHEEVKYTPPVNEDEALRRADSIVSLMSLEEKLDLIKGDKSFFIKGFEKYGIPEIYMSDATQGVHIRDNFMDSDLSDYALPQSTSFPNALALAATWNPDMARQYAKSIGEECRAAGIGILLGPGMNIYRNAQCGRNFEYMGEDPYLAARMVEQYVVGMQNTGTISTLKHFIANQTDYRRRASNSVVDERTLHEIYMPAFKAGVDAGAMAVMTSYNQVNGEWAGQSDFVINYLLRDQLGFENLVMTDWWSVNDAKKLVESGQDIEMPGGESMENLHNLVARGDVDVKDIDRMCRSILKTIAQMDFFDKSLKDPGLLNQFDKHVNVALNTAREGIVLLRNEEDLLPLEANTGKGILVTGHFVEQNVYGGGSGEVAGFDVVTILDALKQEYPDLVYKKEASDAEIQDADIVLLSVGTFDYEGCDRHFPLPADQEALVQRVSQLNDKTVVIVNSGGGIRMTDWNKVKAIVYNWYPGQIGNLALAEILSGKVNPSGKLPMSIEKEFKDSPAYGYIPEDTPFLCDQEGYLSLDNDKFNYWSFDTSIEEAPEKLYDVVYDEGVLVGYRWYDTKNIEPLFPFAYGLSYSSFSVSNVQLSADKIRKSDLLKVSCLLENTGKMDGATTVQLYVGEQNPAVIRPVKELKAFKKVHLKAGETQSINFYLNEDAFSYWDAETKQWTVNSGKFDIYVGQSSKDVMKPLLVSVE